MLKQDKEKLIRGLVAIGLCLIVGTIFFLTASKIKNDAFKEGYMLSCKYQIPNGCDSCTTDAAIKEFCFNAKTQQDIILCNMARQNQANGNEISIFIYENNTRGVRLR